MINRTQDLRVARIRPLISPARLKEKLRITDAVSRTVFESREAVKHILSGKDKRLLVIVGPCSIHDRVSAMEYAGRLNALRVRVSEKLFIVMRVYFEKPRTTIGWKGLIADPFLDNSGDIEEGLKQARKLLLDITAMGLPAATEMLDPIVPQYTADLVTWAAVGARTTESQTHREMASGLSMPVGFKNSTDGNLQIALDAMESARHPHQFLGIDQQGMTSIVKTSGNLWSHLILRGGRNGPNYSAGSIRAAKGRLRAAGLRNGIMVDCSHANSEKKHENQEAVLKSVVNTRARGEEAVMGVMVESNINPGSQPLQKDPSRLKYGVSVTDACIGWDKTEELLEFAWRIPVKPFKRR